MDLVLLSDTHELHREVDVPPGDLLIFAGDFTMFSRHLSAIEDFNDWLGDLPHPHKVVIPGNHEFFLEADPGRRSLLSNATVLIDEGIEIDGLRIWGSPLTPLYGGAFGRSSPSDRERHWSRVPSETHVLITHGPPFGILDCVPGTTEHTGDPELLRAVKGIRPLLHVFGHVHSAYGSITDEHTTYANVALMGQHGELKSIPLRFRLR